MSWSKPVSVNLIQDLCLIACTHFNCPTQTVSSKLIKHLELILYLNILHVGWTGKWCKIYTAVYGLVRCPGTVDDLNPGSFPLISYKHLAVILWRPNLNWNSNVHQILTLKLFCFQHRLSACISGRLEVNLLQIS